MKKHALPRYSHGHLIMINAVACAIEVAVSVAYTYLPPLLLKAGFSSASTGFILGIGPLIAMITVPLLGRLTDNSRCSLGRRRPLIFIFAFVLLVSMMIVIVGQKLIKSAGEEGSFSTVGSILIMLGGILLDYSSQSAMNPCEALLSDLLEGAPRETLDAGFAVYSGLLSFGACLGYFVTAVKWPKPFSSYFSGGQEGAAFAVAMIIFLSSVFMTGFAAKEEPQGIIILERPLLPQKIEGNWISLTVNRRRCCRALIYYFRSIVIYIWKTLLAITEKVFCFPRCVYKEIKSSPMVLQRLFITDVVSWSAIICYNLFYTNYVGQVIYAGNPMAGAGTLQESLYNEGVRMGSWGLLLHSMTACAYASFIQDQIIRRYGLRFAHVCGLMTFSISMVGILCSNEIAVLNVFAAFSGIGFAAITTIPNSLVTFYRSNQEIFFFDVDERRGSGADFAVLNIAYYLGQILLSLVMSNIGQIIGKPICYILFAAIAGFISCYFANRIVHSSIQLINSKDIS